jgi:hypothetical protein
MKKILLFTGLLVLAVACFPSGEKKEPSTNQSSPNDLIEDGQPRRDNGSDLPAPQGEESAAPEQPVDNVTPDSGNATGGDQSSSEESVVPEQPAESHEKTEVAQLADAAEQFANQPGPQHVMNGAQLPSSESGASYPYDEEPVLPGQAAENVTPDLDDAAESVEGAFEGFGNEISPDPAIDQA